jgi:hypothetical protein
MGNSVVGLAGDQVLAIAQADAARMYRDLSLYRIQLVLRRMAAQMTLRRPKAGNSQMSSEECISGVDCNASRSTNGKELGRSRC